MWAWRREALVETSRTSLIAERPKWQLDSIGIWRPSEVSIHAFM
jgi:hypothetical protein